MLTALLLLPALAAAATPVDVGRPMPAGTPVVLVVESPGLARESHQPLFDALEAAGLDAWAVALTSPDPQELLDARATLPVDHLLVGQGLGGTAAARSVQVRPARALALLGAPLSPPHSALLDSLRSQPVPPGGLDLAASVDRTWQDRRILPLLLGEPLPPLTRLDGAWLEALAAWQEPVDLTALPCPTWVGIGDLDEVGQAEAIRPWLPADARVVRFGRLRLDGHAFAHGTLLASPRSTAAAARWLADVAAVPTKEGPCGT